MVTQEVKYFQADPDTKTKTKKKSLGGLEIAKIDRRARERSLTFPDVLINWLALPS